MPEYYAFQAALYFSIAHIYVRRDLVGYKTLTGSVISLGTGTVIISSFASFLVLLSLFRRRAAQCWSYPVFFFSALNVGTVVRVDSSVVCIPLLTILWAAIFLRQVETLSWRVMVGTVLVATVK